MIISLSGGMDSTTLLYEYSTKIELAISFNYHSKHNNKEINFAKYHCDLLGIKHRIINLDFFKDFSSSLIDKNIDIPEGHYEDETMKSTVVPFRNGIMLSILTGIAEDRNIDKVLIANHFGDHAIYPDCRKSFIDSFNASTKNGTYNKVEIVSPYNLLSKRDIAIIGNNLGIDWSKTWSCYKGGDIHCGKCGTCVERIEALEGFDNTIYEKNN